MPRDPTLRPRILEAAIPLFVRRGRYGVTKDAVIEAAKISKGSMNRLYASIDQLCEDTLACVITQLSERFKTAAEAQINNSEKSLWQIIRGWYQALPQETACFLQQVMMHDPKNRDLAYSPLKQFVDQLTLLLEHQNAHKSSAILKSSAENLMWSLFQLKINRHGSISASKESAILDRKIQHWIDNSAVFNQQEHKK